MTMSQPYSAVGPQRAEIDAWSGAAVLEFGTDWCGYCQAAQSLLQPLFAQHPELRHCKIEDGPGRPLGRSFGVKLWPTLIFLRDGKELARIVRPTNAASVRDALAQIDPTGNK